MNEEEEEKQKKKTVVRASVKHVCYFRRAPRIERIKSEHTGGGITSSRFMEVLLTFFDGRDIFSFPRGCNTTPRTSYRHLIGPLASYIYFYYYNMIFICL